MSDSDGEKPKSKQRTPPLFLDAPDKTTEALETFTAIPECSYQNKSLGDSGQHESMTCDCVENWDKKTGVNLACGEDSGCINRATSVECINKHSHCGENCSNQRFQRKQYANISVFQTEKKGYGLKANSKIEAYDFIYEYIGEVIDENAFRKRMVEYDTRQIKHFYFMMLKKDSFIDATKKGSLARFVNHSCSPNAYVDKWVVGDKLRMGIFAKRNILPGEEITFDYNVDRYGAQSQPCYCGEPNCMKFMGGKTQTDAALLLPDGISEALGVSPQMERQWLKENKHLKSKQKEDSTVNELFIKSIEVEPLEEEDVNKVMSSLMKTQDLNIIKKLIERIFLTKEEAINLQIIKLHGYKTLSTLLKSIFKEDDEIITMILTILNKWPKFTKNKISSSQIEDVVKDIRANSRNREIKGLCANLLDAWGNLQMAYRIPKKNRVSRSPEADDDVLPPGWETAFDENTKKTYYFNRVLGESTWEKPTVLSKTATPVMDLNQYSRGTSNEENHSYIDSRTSENSQSKLLPKGPKAATSSSSFNESATLAQLEEDRLKKEKELLWIQNQHKQKSLQDLILQSQREAEEKKQLDERMKQESIAAAKAKAKAKAKVKSKKESNGKSSTETLEKRWSTTFAKHVPNFIKKYETEIGRDNLKGCARDIVKLLADKEMHKEPVKVPPEELEKAKLKKVKDFTRSYMDKFIIKFREKKKKRHHHDDENGAKRHHGEKTSVNNDM